MGSNCSHNIIEGPILSVTPFGEGVTIEITSGSCMECNGAMYGMRKKGSNDWTYITKSEFYNIVTIPDGYRWIKNKYKF